MTALNASTGKVLWNNKDVHGQVVAFRRNKVIAFDGSKAFTLDPAKGTVIDTVAVTNVGFFKSESMKDGTLYAVSPLGVVTKLSPK
jgi:outer membrane protein assembly factor BamB